MKTKYIIMYACIFFFSCKGGNQGDNSVSTIDEVTFDKVDTLYFVDSVSTSQAFYMSGWKILDRRAVVRASRAEKILYVYSYPQFKFLYSFGEIGRASGEFLTHNWCVTKEQNLVSLYDIMKSSLYTYSVGNEQMTIHESYSLSKDEDGVCRPYTRILQLNDSLFLMKEDGDETNLHFVNMKKGNILATYHCGLRDGKKNSYTPFDYDFNIVGNRILLAYNYIQRMELLSITPNGQLIPQVFIGDDDLGELPQNYDELPNVWLEICSDEHYFYCLRSDGGLEVGSNVYVWDADGKPVRRIMLDRQINSIQIDKEGRLVAYQETDNGSLFYIYDK
ncbi:BF3164 family lipoprotein [Paraprevotella xylaniphila]|uniref:BF3164 family lipoprotein n=1 Tax=Paraprevotella xylaniphila TaxID=454155 RepID=UPI00266D95B0|nr:BF3164 family lipoprotein [Paraprevotella xylaniphila]